MSCQQKPIGGDTPQPSPAYGEGLVKANRIILDILPTNCPEPQTLETRGEGEVVGAEEPGGDPLSEQIHNPPPVDSELGHLENENTNFPQTMLTFLELSQGRVEELTSLLRELSGTPLTTEMTCKWLGLDFKSKVISHDSHIKLIDGLSEDPEDHPVSFIPIIERHNARLEKAHLLHAATRPTVEQKWAEGATLKDIVKFLYSWAPEPYRNKPMPQGMVQALLCQPPTPRHGTQETCPTVLFAMQKPQTPSTTW